MGSGIAGKRRLPRQRTADHDAAAQAGTPAGEGRRSRVPSWHSTDLISLQPLSDEERRDRWLRNTGTLWRPESEGAARQRF